MLTHPSLKSARNRGRLITKAAVVATLAAAPVVGLAVAPASAVVNAAPDSKVWQANGLVRTTLETPTAIYIGGDFTELTGPGGQTVARADFAALDPTTGAPLPLQADTNRQVWSIAASADYSRIYLAGDFQKVGGVNRHRVAAVDATTGSVLAFNPNLNDRAESVLVNGSMVYVGGDFTTVAGASHSHIAAVDATTGALIPSFTATASSYVTSMVLSLDGSRLFVGGDFSSMSNVSSTSYLAEVNPTSGAVTSWPSRPSDLVRALAVSATQVAAGVGGGSNSVTVWSTTGVRQWTDSTNGDIQAVTFQSGVLYVGGHFQTFGSRTTGHLVAVSAADGSLLTWTAKPNSSLGVFSLTSFDNHLSVGGAFTKINSIGRAHYARFDEL
jgi:hypothetical protein